MEKYAVILVDIANRRLDRNYHYKIPAHLSLQVGMTVLVPFQNRKVQGLVVQLTDELRDLEETKLREVEKIIEAHSRIPQDLIELATWLAETTVCSIAQALHAVWPLLKGKVQNWVVPMANITDEDVIVLKLLDPQAHKVLTVLHRSRQGALAESVLLQRAGVGPELLEEMHKQGWIRKESRFTGASQKNKQVDQNTEGKADSIKNPEGMLKPQLSSQQKQAVEEIWKAYERRDGGTLLLHGVTGSGKTEVYREVVSSILQEGGDVILLVPEISLTAQLSDPFYQAYGDQIGVVHSGLTANEKIELWKNTLNGKKRMIIGARSAVFAPLPNLRLIIVDEEHDQAYKQDENPKYHAREVARKRMVQRKGLVLLGSATPSLEAYAATQRKKIDLITLGERFNNRPLPTVEIVDMKQELANGNKSIFSHRLQTLLHDRIQKGEQSILFLNRRGYSTFVFCRECGFVARCPHCDVSLTYHSTKGTLTCHYCDYQREVYHLCPECGSKYIRFFGQGTQKVEEEIFGLFPGVPVLRLDADTTAGNGKHQEILDRFRYENIPILVGTQMLAKGLDFPNVTLVGVIAADQLLNRPDFRSREKAFQLLTQVAGRAGRGNKPGDVVIQTYSPTDPAIRRAAKQDYPAFFWEELAYRRKLSYPPFAHIIRVLLYHEKEERVIAGAQGLSRCIQQAIGEENEEQYLLLGPAPAVLSKLRNEYRWQLSIKGKDPAQLRRIVHQGVKAFAEGPFFSGINLSIDLNPLSD